MINLENRRNDKKEGDQDVRQGRVNRGAFILEKDDQTDLQTEAAMSALHNHIQYAEDCCPGKRNTYKICVQYTVLATLVKFD